MEFLIIIIVVGALVAFLAYSSLKQKKKIDDAGKDNNTTENR